MKVRDIAKKWTVRSKDGLSYQAKFTVKDRFGKSDRITKTIRISPELKGKKKDEYLATMYFKLREELQGTGYKPKPNIKFSELAEIWMTDYVRQNLAETTQGHRETHLNVHILPFFGEMKVSDINVHNVEQFLNTVQRKDIKGGELSHESRLDLYKTLKSIFTECHRWNLVEQNIMSEVKKPIDNSGKVKPELNVFSEEEVHQVFKLLQNEPARWRVFVFLDILGGFRRGELLALRWDDIDYESKVIRVRHNLVKVKNGKRLKNPKTAKSSRLITMPDHVFDVLNEFREEQAEHIRNMEGCYEDPGQEWLFMNEKGTSYHPDSVTTWWSRFLVRNEVRHVPLKNLRHTSATLLLAKGEHMRIIADRLGHSSTRLTEQTYTTVTLPMAAAAAKKLDSLKFK